jgi:antitoxin (DNA-binding transcriptional repressor) of toxin-antitoxin stability system
MKTISLEQATLDTVISDAQRENVIIKRHGKPVVLIIGIEGIDEEQLQLGASDKFWGLISERRKQKTISRADLEKLEASMHLENSLDVVRAWLNAVNSRDYELVIERSDPDIEIVGPRGSGYGHQLLRDWLDHARLSLETLRAFARGDTVVVAQRGIWRSVETGEVIGEADVASLFRVEGGRVAQYARYDSLAEALKQAGLDYADETPE